MVATVFLSLRELENITVGKFVSMQIGARKYPAKIDFIDFRPREIPSKYDVRVLVENVDLPMFEGLEVTINF